MRVMLTLLALLAVAVTVARPPTELYQYVPAGALVLLVISIWITQAVRSRLRRTKSVQLSAVDQPEESLADVGILEIRAKAQESPGTEVQGDEESHSEISDEDSDNGALESEPATVGATKSPYTSLPDPSDTRILGAILEGFRLALGAHAVLAVRRTEKEDEYKIIDTAGSDWAKSRGSCFQSGVPLLPAEQEIAVRTIGNSDLPPQSLTYSSRPGMIKRLAVASAGTLPLLLLADTTEDFGLTHPRARELVKQFAQTLGLLFYKEDPYRPRREIIAEEMARARSHSQPLALALVLINKSESIAAAGEGVIRRVEDRLSERLQKASGRNRVERFGEMLFGVFIDGRRENIENWNARVQRSVAEDDGLLNSGVTIGIAILNDQHKDADAMREDAMQALVQAYESGSQTVVA